MSLALFYKDVDSFVQTLRVWSNFGAILNYTGVESENTCLTVPGPAGAPPIITR